MKFYFLEIMDMEHIKKSHVRILAITCMLLFGSIQPVIAASVAASQAADARLRRVALFKNGLGFFVSEVTIPENKDSFRIVPSVAPSHGTFWVAYPSKVPFRSLVACQVDSEELVEAVTIAELLKANVGREVKLYFSEKEDLIKGVVKYISEDRERPRPEPYAPGRSDYSRNRYGQLIQPARLMIVETTEAEVAVNPQSVRRVEFPEGEIKDTFSKKSKSVEFEVQMDAPAGAEKLTVSYLAKGITWAPSYMVDITRDARAHLSAKAAIINEACELNDVSVQLVTGYPNLQFADVVSPLALKEDLAQFLQALAKGQSERGALGGVMSNVMMQRAAWSGLPGGESIMPAYGTAEAGKVAEDLFLYPVEKVHLNKGAVGYFALFTESVPYKHIYQWKIPDYVNKEDRYYDRRRREKEGEPDEEVWHCLRLENKTKVPWTTAPAQIVKDGIILGQDTLNFCPAEGETTLRITRAVGVKAEQLELETDRQREAARMYGYSYDLITVEGKLSVTNFQPKDITLEITKTLSGQVKSSQPEARVEKLARGLLRMNAMSELTWTVKLEPGEHQKLGYVYDVYVRR